MTDRIKKEIERLLEEPGEGDQASNRVRSRLVATLSEGLGEAVPGASGTDIATMAAFLDGKLSESERERFASDLARQPALRADLESAASLVEETSTGKRSVPKHLMAQASAQFAPTPAPQRPNIASSPKMSPGPKFASVIERPSGCSRTARAWPERTT